ncbi:type II secretion system protein GspC [Lacimicrobium alkaliphilum]|uniref:Type II secretion system protein GspC n=1 Tax=Lacimicrobium alkaliphilum TaxID=1526571 RepID=A0ABQ1RSR9_9ALTE|nr:type II secretion system protein GspC [Lacimicrobium alkaliphilum]GGD76890.1 type II secretion system protein GspC [Lacimicrobium alkaliphilum]
MPRTHGRATDRNPGSNVIAINHNNIQQIGPWLIRHQDTAIKIVVVLLSLYLLAFAAELTWKLIPEPDATSQQVEMVSRTQAVNADNSLDIDKIQQLHLFGKPQAERPVQRVVENAPQTNLNLTLTGLVASDIPRQGAAIIENRNQQNTYGVGEKVDGTNVVVKEVLIDRIIIQNGSRMETLMLDGVDFKKGRAVLTPSNPQPQPQRTSPRQLSEQAVSATQELMSQPANFTDYIAISQHMAEGELKGYRVSPGKKPALFNAVGLQANDIVTEINGLDLTDIQQSMEAMSMLRETDSLQLTVDRDGELLTLYLDLPADDLQ